MARSAKVFLLGVVVWCVAAGGASAGVVSDGKRWAAWPTGPGEVAVYDGLAAEDPRTVAVPDCPLAAVGGARVAVTCWPGLATIVDIATGARTEVDVRSSPAFEGSSWVGVGRRGLLALVRGFTGHSELHTGFDLEIGVRELDDPRRALDLDRPGLSRPLCAPLRRTATPWTDRDLPRTDPYAEMLYARPWAVEALPGGTVRAWRCGERRPRVLAKRCACSAQLGNGLVAWRGRDGVRAVDLATGRRRSWSVETGESLAVAGRTLIVWSPRSSGGVTPRLRLIRWPKPRR